uniref:Uncharacterized protein n=1 Tax=Anguilla anguilla TaxID=7936 RepID=A0A0E9TWJ4_ANGAN
MMSFQLINMQFIQGKKQNFCIRTATVIHTMFRT